ncbi:MAG: Dabb family protein [Sphaerochaeta sp.]
MVRHIVLWNFNDSVKEEDKKNIKKGMKENLEALLGKVPGLQEIKFIENSLEGSTHEFALFTEFDTEEHKRGYSTHPSHVHVANTFVRPFTADRKCLDYEVE